MVVYLLDTVINEIFSFRESHRFGVWVIYLEIAAMAISIAVPYLSIEIVIATIYSFLYPILLMVIGLRRSSLYTFTSFILFLSISMPMAMVFRGNIINVYRFSLVALSTLSIGILFLSSLHPSMVKGNTYLYLLTILLNSMLREVRDILTVFRARGEHGLKLYVRSITVSIIVTFSRIETLVDSLRSRGIEIE